MELKVENQKENALMNRTEVNGSISFTAATPSNKEVAKAVANNAKADASLVVVKSIYTTFGETNAKFTAYVYKTKETMDQLEKKGKKALEKEANAKKKAEEAAKAAAEAKKKAEEEAKAAAEAPKEEAKAEEKTAAEQPKEEAKAEGKQETEKPAEEAK